MIKKLKHFKEKNAKSQKGVSLIVLVITIIVIIIIATISFVANDGTISEATIATYKHELKDVEVSVSQTRIRNQQGRNWRRNKRNRILSNSDRKSAGEFCEF